MFHPGIPCGTYCGICEATLTDDHKGPCDECGSETNARVNHCEGFVFLFPEEVEECPICGQGLKEKER